MTMIFQLFSFAFFLNHYYTHGTRGFSSSASGIRNVCILRPARKNFVARVPKQSEVFPSAAREKKKPLVPRVSLLLLFPVDRDTHEIIYHLQSNRRS